jgi:hypothetical protein
VRDGGLQIALVVQRPSGFMMRLAQEAPTQCRRGKGQPLTIADCIRLFCAHLKTLWNRSPWWPAAKIWIAPTIEADFMPETAVVQARPCSGLLQSS